ncbi:hypothetical protein [Candidatus Nitrosarchaeum limnium]|uniref:Uncharacterized protein n=1 Tax=Candidatus Nitrosarchaeum limnium BG20 TaxID=859192 RepID=S2EK44_9ARCH|nr:hypothetical protein [Candidatus Nitrosarchaeum limnium]EPA05037.1 hypothetical protein BG20_I1707 [Candidatus Nitrosarchaeum limnium BG20]
MNPLFQLSTRSYETEIPIVTKALQELEAECKVKDGFTVEKPFEKFGWTFFNIQISMEMTEVIESSGMMKGALGFKIGEQLTNFIGHYLETKGSNVRIKKINY